MKIAILTCGILPIPAVQGGAVENMIDFYLDYNDRKKIHDITVYSPFAPGVDSNPALTSSVNHYIYIDVSSLWARARRWLYGRLHKDEYYNHFIEYYFEQIFADLSRKHFDLIVLENSPGHVYKLSQRGFHNIALHLNNDLLNSQSRHHDAIFNGLTRIITCSDYIRRRVCTIRHDGKVQTLYNAIDVGSFVAATPARRSEMSLSDDDFVIVYSGRVNKDKGVAELIDAMLLLRDIPRLKLMIIGGTFYGNAGDEDPFVRTLKEKAMSIKDRIVFTGFVPYAQVPACLHTADIAVLPSMWEEPFGLTIVEAMAAGLPLVTTRSGGIPEICEGVATIVEKENVAEGLAAAIRDLYRQPEKRRQMCDAARQRAWHFDKEAYARDFLTALSACQP